MKTPTNHEDNALMREGARKQARALVQKMEMRSWTMESLNRIKTALVEDYALTPQEAADFIRECL